MFIKVGNYNYWWIMCTIIMCLITSSCSQYFAAHSWNIGAPGAAELSSTDAENPSTTVVWLPACHSMHTVSCQRGYKYKNKVGGGYPAIVHHCNLQMDFLVSFLNHIIAAMASKMLIMIIFSI